VKALIVAAGEAPSDALLRERAGRSELKIAVDGGVVAFKKADVVPELSVGDMDSADEELLAYFAAQGSGHISLAREKDDTDTFVALEEAAKRGAADVLILGAMGGRIDHLLSNIMLLKWALQNGVRAVLEDDSQTIEACAGSFEIMGEPGQTVSILPMDASATVTAAGLRYPLDGLVLTNGRPRGVSNVLRREKATVHTSGPVLVIKNKMSISARGTFR
jgi:thiamine pyrophosphokinase